MAHQSSRQRSSSGQREHADEPRRSNRSIPDSYEPRYANPIFPKPEDSPTPGSSPPAQHFVVGGAAEQQSRRSTLLLKFVRSVALDNYAACEKFIDENPEVWDTDRKEYVQRAIEFLVTGDKESKTLALSCMEKLVVLDSCGRHPPGTSFLKELRGKRPAPKILEEFRGGFARLKDYCEAQAKDKSQHARHQRSHPMYERNSQQNVHDDDQSRQERTRTQRQEKLPQRIRETDDNLPLGRHSVAAIGGSKSVPRTKVPVVQQRTQPRESLDRLETLPHDRHSHQRDRSRSSDSVNSDDDDTRSTDPQSLKDRKRQESASRHSAAPHARRDSYSTGARSSANIGAVRRGSQKNETTLPLRHNSRQSSERQTQSGTADLNTPTRSSKTGQQRRDGPATREAQFGSSPPDHRLESAPPGIPPRPPGPPTYRRNQPPTLDPAFEAIPQNRWDDYFKQGRVFAVLIYSANTRNDGVSEGGSLQKTTDQFGNPIYTHFQRMVVVGRSRGFCWAIPINTYRGRGLGKPGLSAANIEAHAIIHMINTPARWLDGEPQSSKRPIVVNPESSEQRLNRASRINFERVHTVDLNVRIVKIGTVVAESIPFLERYFREERERVSRGR